MKRVLIFIILALVGVGCSETGFDKVGEFEKGVICGVVLVKGEQKAMMNYFLSQSGTTTSLAYDNTISFEYDELDKIIEKAYIIRKMLEDMPKEDAI